MATIDIDVVSNGPTSDVAILKVREMLPGSVVAINIIGMVESIEARVGGGDKIGRLRIFGHGAPGLACVGSVPSGVTLDNGDDILSRHSLRTIRIVERSIPEQAGGSVTRPKFSLLNELPLSQLQSKFARTGWAELHVCRVAEQEIGKQLLKALARLWRVRVAGGTGEQIAGGGLENSVFVASPTGSVTRRVPPSARTGGCSVSF